MKKFPTAAKINDVIPFVHTPAGIQKLKFVGVKYPNGLDQGGEGGTATQNFPSECSGNVFFCNMDEYTERNGPAKQFYVAVWHRTIRNENPKAFDFLVTNDGTLVIKLATTVALPNPAEVLAKMSPSAKKNWFK